MSWEPQSSTLSYVRAARPGGRLEFRALRIEAANAAQTQASAGATVLMQGENLLRTDGASIVTEGIRRHSCCGARGFLLRSPQVGPTIKDPGHTFMRSAWAYRTSA